MAEVPDTVDDAIDALPDAPSTDEVFIGTRDFSSREVASAAAAAALSGSGGVGASAPLTLTAADAAVLPLSIVGAPAQDAPYWEARDSDGNVKARLDSFGTIDLQRTINIGDPVDTPTEQVVFGLDGAGFVLCEIRTDHNTPLAVKKQDGTIFVRVIGNGSGETVEITPTADGDAGLSVVKHSGTQTANLIEVWDETFSTVLFAVTPSGGIRATLPTANPGPGLLWNDGGTVKVGT